MEDDGTYGEFLPHLSEGDSFAGLVELCGGFGHKGVVKIVEAVEGKVPVGAIRFDNHPKLEGKSGDEIF